MGSLAVVSVRSGNPDIDAAERMLSAAAHRGTEHERRICGRTVLAVSHDPDYRDAWVTGGEQGAAALTGALDNPDQVARDLRGAGVDVDGVDPATLVLRAFSVWGDDAPAHFRGSYAAAVTDGHIVRCFRDHIGYASLFCRNDDRAFLAASEPKQVVAGAAIPREPDVEVVEGIFFSRFDDRKTALKGVERVPHASVFVAGNGAAPTARRYWSPSPDLVESVRMSHIDAVDRLRELLDQATTRTVTGQDVISLSGGIDSPTVAAFAAPAHLARSGRPLQAVSTVYPDHPSVDELPYIEAVTERLKLPLQTYVIEGSPISDLGFWVQALDGPWDTLPVPIAAQRHRLVRDLGARTILTGDLAEAIFTMTSHLIGHLVLHGRWRAAARWMAAKREAGLAWRPLLRSMAPSLTPAFAAKRYIDLRYRDPQEVMTAPWIDPDRVGGRVRPDLAVPARKRWSDLQLAMVSDRASVALEASDMGAAFNGVRVRRPLTDVDLCEFFASLPAEVKFPDLIMKSLVREAMRGMLPDMILDRRKKTAFDAHVRDTADYEGLSKWLVRPSHRVRGIDYPLLERRIERREMELFELVWAYDLARLHAFLAGFE